MSCSVKGEKRPILVIIQVLGVASSLLTRWVQVFKTVEAHQDITVTGSVGE